MAHPKLKYPRLCRLLTYVVVLGCAIVPCAVILCLPFIPEWLKVLCLLVIAISLLVYLIKNFPMLMGMDMLLAMLSCYRTARTQYSLPEGRTAEQIKNRLLRWGIRCEPSPILPKPQFLRYRFKPSATIYTKGIEQIVSAYEVDLLDMDTYRAILASIKTNSSALLGKKKPRLLDKQQKDAPLNRVTVAVIFAKQVDSKLSSGLYELLDKQCGDGFDVSILPCVIDLQARSCVFNSLRIPYIGFSYPVKNRGIRLIRKAVFGGRLPLPAEHYLPPIEDVDPECSLWMLWRELQEETQGQSKAEVRRFENMVDQEILIDEDFLFLKWGEHGISEFFELDAEAKTVTFEAVGIWSYPKVRPIAKKTIAQIESHIRHYFESKGYAVTFED